MNMILKSIWIYACNTARYAVTLMLGYGLYLSSKYALYAPSNPTQPVFFGWLFSEFQGTWKATLTMLRLVGWLVFLNHIAKVCTKF